MSELLFAKELPARVDALAAQVEALQAEMRAMQEALARMSDFTELARSVVLAHRAKQEAFAEVERVRHLSSDDEPRRQAIFAEYQRWWDALETRLEELSAAAERERKAGPE